MGSNGALSVGQVVLRTFRNISHLPAPTPSDKLAETLR